MCCDGGNLDWIHSDSGSMSQTWQHLQIWCHDWRCEKRRSSAGPNPNTRKKKQRPQPNSAHRAAHNLEESVSWVTRSRQQHTHTPNKLRAAPFSRLHPGSAITWPQTKKKHARRRFGALLFWKELQLAKTTHACYQPAAALALLSPRIVITDLG